MVEEEEEEVEEEGQPSLVRVDPCQLDAFLKSRPTQRIRHRIQFLSSLKSTKEKFKLLRSPHYSCVCLCICLTTHQQGMVIRSYKQILKKETVCRLFNNCRAYLMLTMFKDDNT
jgi:hypothetical protein